VEQTSADRRPTDRGTSKVIASIRAHLAKGAPWAACDVFRDAVGQASDDAELLYLGALAHARAGAAREAYALLDRAQPLVAGSPGLLTEILSLRGRLWKDRLHRARDAAMARESASTARNEYGAAYALNRDPYPGINAASLALILGEQSAARQLSREIITRLTTQQEPLTCWDQATLGEAHLLLGELDRARESYATAYAIAPGDAGSVASMRRQVRLIARVVPAALALLDVLPAPTVTAFAGHMIDAPQRRMPRFPAALEPAVTAAIRDRLARMNRPILYTSAACGADLIAIEVALELGTEVNVLLPFNRDDFVRTSVAVGGAGWIERFDAALARATRVIAATQESHLGDDVLFEHAAMLVEGLTALRAAQLETAPRLLCVLDAVERGQVGGTRRSYERWSARFGAPDVIDLAALRNTVAHDPRPNARRCRHFAAGSDAIVSVRRCRGKCARRPSAAHAEKRCSSQTSPATVGCTTLTRRSSRESSGKSSRASSPPRR
jgi:tetratricopeptide (TPR) repeat protein